ncbi:LPS translocon maturation chaperone LptM [Xanthobacter sp. AM11]|uniref:LPS translocon maturation chaperone LptM n=1 Tax=Xanthobacter sp. AM11 TaxID=3380643 RepID=UPI0039BF19F9
MLRLRILLALCGTLAVAACGVKGPLEPPPGAQAAPPPSKPAAAATAEGSYVAPRSSTDIQNSATPHADWQTQKKPTSSGSQLLQGVQRPQQPFILDGLL